MTETLAEAPGTRGRLVSAAARLFLARSYHAVGVDELCATAGVRKGSFYYHFSSKADLMKAVIDRHADALWTRLATTADLPDPASRLRGLIDAVGAIQEEFESYFGTVVGCPFGNLAAEVAAADADLAAHLQQIFGTWQRCLSEQCRQAAAEGVLVAGTDPDQLARILLAQFQGMILLAKTDSSPARDITAALHDVLDHYLVQERLR
ncbi:TetR/AcrR family transcriptional regulator [Streptomyces sp. NPDC126514]|uniref:TetR/AcrR family transcriptional regulator n=1 Tax=Streptomyces sp. NPDC126514 TaxID=3155210 RepID=UPI003321A089